MRLFLIDYENVNSAGLHGIGQIQPEDRVILFYSHAANTLSFEVMDEMMMAGITPERICLEHTGKNALDFQLVTFLGYLVAAERADAYYIISRDTGYNAAIVFCQNYLGVKVQLRPSIKQALGKLASGKQTVSTAAKKPVKQVRTPALPVVPEPRQEAAKSAKPARKAAVQPIEATKPVKAAKAVKPAPKATAKKVQKSHTPAETQEPAVKRKTRTSVSLHKRASVIPLAQATPARKEEVIPVDLETVMALVQPAVSVPTASDILQCLLASKSKTEFHNALQQHFDNETVKHYYHCLKPCFVTFAE